MPDLDFSREQIAMLLDLIHVKELSLQRDIARADECGSLDYVEILVDELTKYKTLREPLEIAHSIGEANAVF